MTNHEVGPSPIILVADDVEETRDGIERLLKADGYRVDPARDEEDAVERANRQRPDLILASLGRPGADSVRSAQRIRRRAQLDDEVPVVIFCRHEQLVGVHAVVAQEQPAAEALFNRVKAVADGRLGDLGDESLGIAEEDVLEWTASCELIPQHARLHPEGSTGYLHDRPVGGGIAAQEQGHTDDSIAARQPHLGSRTVFHGVEQRHDRRRREVHVLQKSSRLVHDLAESEGHRLERVKEAFPILSGKARENTVPCRTVSFRRFRHRPSTCGTPAYRSLATATLSRL